MPHLNAPVCRLSPQCGAFHFHDTYKPFALLCWRGHGVDQAAGIRPRMTPIRATLLARSDVATRSSFLAATRRRALQFKFRTNRPLLVLPQAPGAVPSTPAPQKIKGAKAT